MMDNHDAESRRRIDQFVDAAFGFAVTLLVITGGQPANLAELRSALWNIPASAAAFALIVLFWLAHRAFGRLTNRRDGLGLLLSLAIVFTMLVYVFPLKLLMQSLFYWMSFGRLPGEGLINSFGDLANLYQTYGLGFAILSGLYAGLFGWAMRWTETSEALDEARSWRDSWLICAASGAISTALALLPLEAASWIPPTTYSFIPVAIWIRERMAARALKKSSAAEAEPADA